jgi:hypothetical protein
MTLTIELTPEEEARLTAAARSVLLAPEALIRRWVGNLPLIPSSDMTIPVTQSGDASAEANHERRIAALDQVIQLLRSAAS